MRLIVLTGCCSKLYGGMKAPSSCEKLTDDSDERSDWLSKGISEFPRR